MIKPPERQSPYQEALARAFEAVRTRNSQYLSALGAVETGSGCYELPVLEGRFLVNLSEEKISVKGNRAEAEAGIRVEWQILALHYLSARPPYPKFARWISFGDIMEARGYEGVHRSRVLDRLCATAGRDRDTFVEAGLHLGARHFEGGDQGFRFQVFPSIPVVIAWYAGDEEFKPNASFLYPDNIMSFLSVEDIVVLSERLVGRLQNREW